MSKTIPPKLTASSTTVDHLDEAEMRSKGWRLWAHRIAGPTGVATVGSETMRSPYTRYSNRHYEDAVRLTCEIEKGLEAFGYSLPERNIICELVRARFANMFAQDNPKFDSFGFSNAARCSGKWETPDNPGDEKPPFNKTRGG